MKRKISDLMGHLPGAQVEIEYSAPLSYSRIEELTMSKIMKKKTNHKRIGFRLLAAAAIIAALTLSGVASYHYGGWFQNFFAARNNDHLTDDQLTVLEEHIVELNQSVTDSGYTVTLESVVSDGTNTFLKFMVEALDGRVMDGDYYYCAPFRIDIPELPEESNMVRGITAGWDHVVDENVTDNAAPLLMEVNASAGSVPGELWTLELSKLVESRGAGQGTEDIVLAEGTWNFEFTLPSEDGILTELDMLTVPVTIQAQTYLDNSSVPDKAVDVSMTSFILRPLSAFCTYAYTEELKVDPVTVVLKDGTVITAHFSAASMDLDTATVQHTFRFETPIPLDQVDYVEFPGDVKIQAN
ncbi:MAG: DUF4179 domain-containing protein [Oscillospiraceae bacterium]|nr:DUF4179 domain-containing protein [Oscillospiraceae bacterium]